MAEPWWKEAVVYQIYPRSFCDTNGDGVGDLEGIRRHLDHLTSLGIDAIWISPFFRSPMKDYGYDVADYCDVDPLFGSLADFDQLLAECHEHDIKVLIDWVPNHTSDQHEWFVEARRSRSSAKRDWYIWRDGSAEKPPNNWRGAFLNGPAWTWDKATEQWYLHLFLPEQPDLNWRNPEVVAAMHDTLRFWLDRGVDGFRVDVVHGLMKHPELLDLPDDSPRNSQLRFDVEGTYDLIRGFRKLLAEYDGDRMMVGETFVLSTAAVAAYYGDGDLLQLAFNFLMQFTPWDAERWRRRIDRVVEELDPRGAWPTWVLSNHDTPRHRTRLGNDARARAAAVVLLTLRGTPFLYAGEELGLEDAVVPPERVLDPGGRDGCRAPIPWTAEPDHGWGVTDPWLPWPPDASKRAVEVQARDGASILDLYARLLAARRASPALRLGSWSPIQAPAGALAYQRELGDDRRCIVANFTDKPLALDLGTWTIEVASHKEGEGSRYAGTIPPEGALVLRPLTS